MRNPSILFVLFCLPIAAVAQHQFSLPARTDQITLDMQPGKQVDISSSPGIRRYKGNVRLRQRGVMLFCDRAVHQLTTNMINAAGHVLLVQNDSLTLKSDSLVYDSASQQVTLIGHVLLQNGQAVLTTTLLDYDLRTGIAHHSGKGRLADGRTIQTSLNGFYNVRTKQLETSQATKDQQRNVPDHLTTAEAAVATTIAQRQNERSIGLTMSPQSNNIGTKPESVGTYIRPLPAQKRPIQPVTSVRKQEPDESDLEQLLNRRKRAF